MNVVLRQTACPAADDMRTLRVALIVTQPACFNFTVPLLPVCTAGVAACPPGDHWALLSELLDHVQGALIDSNQDSDDFEALEAFGRPQARDARDSASRDRAAALRARVAAAQAEAQAGALLWRHGVQLAPRDVAGLDVDGALLVVKQLLAKAQRYVMGAPSCKTRLHVHVYMFACKRRSGASHWHLHAGASLPCSFLRLYCIHMAQRCSPAFCLLPAGRAPRCPTDSGPTSGWTSPLCSPALSRTCCRATPRCVSSAARRCWRGATSLWRATWRAPRSTSQRRCPHWQPQARAPENKATSLYW